MCTNKILSVIAPKNLYGILIIFNVWLNSPSKFLPSKLAVKISKNLYEKVSVTLGKYDLSE